MTSGITVTYDTTTFSPTPLVNYSYQPINFGYIYGYNTDISLEGLYTGISTTGAAISFLTGAFANQFRTLTVSDTSGNQLYQWSGVTVDSVSFDSNHYFQGSFVRYSVKLKSFSCPSGVMEPSNEYSFTQNEDGTVNVNHKISARGVRNSTSAFTNAINFVKLFTGKDPYSNCAPILVPGGSGCLMSISENINRADSVYSVTEVYKYNTGAFTPYVKTSSLSINDSLDAEFRTIDYNVKFAGSPVNKNVQAIISSLNYSLLNDIASEFGFSTTNWVKNSYSANVDSGSSVVDIKVGYLSGANPNGFFDYNVSYDYDYLTNIENWKIDGDFKCFGPLDYKLKQLQSFKTANSTNSWRNYLTGLIVASPIFQANHSSSQYFSPNLKISVNENTGLAALKLSMEMPAGFEPDGIADLKYSVDVTPSRWIYELVGSSNIEGSYVIQDLQTRTQTKQKFSVSCRTNIKDSGAYSIMAYVDNLSKTYVSSGDANNTKAFINEEILNTGTYDHSFSRSWIGDDLGVTTGLLSLQAIGYDNSSVPIRKIGYDFGY